MMQNLQIFLFGAPRLERDGQPIPINRRKMLALLAYLIVTRQTHSREALAARFWPEFDSSSALANLRRDLSRLKEILGDGCLLIEREKVQVNPDAAIWVDTIEFETVIRQVEIHGHFRPGGQDTPPCEHCLGLLEEAARIYTGDFMSGFNLPDSPAFDEWQFFQSERLRGILASVLSQLARWHIAQGAYEAAIEYARRWLALDPLHEPAQRMVMQLYAWSGQPSAALRQYHSLFELLEKELGAQPEAETSALYEAIHARRVTPPEPSISANLQDVVSEITHQNNEPGFAGTRLVDLPIPPLPLIGREAELSQLRGFLTSPDRRLVTLVGTGGIGKTRLAIEAAARTHEFFSNGVVFISLAPVTEEENILQTIASALRIRYSPGIDPKEQLLRLVRNLHMLLILDNMEHLLPAAGLLTEMLAAAPDLHLLVTSRERLDVMEEWIYEVGGLPFPLEDEPIHSGADSGLRNFGAVQLFIERARQVKPDLIMDQETLMAISRICRLVEGMPLALELAAAWVRSLSCKEIAQELEQGLDLLTTSMRNLPDRHHSIRVIFDQSWQTLSPAERALLARFSVFHNGCSREAAEQVAEARLPNLTSLVDKALLRYRANRYEMHELVRQYADERLREYPQQQEMTLDRHHRYYLELVAQATPWLKGGRQIEASIKINTDIDNVRSGWRRAIERGDREALARAAEGYWLFHEFSGFLAQGEAAFRLAADSLTHSVEPGPAEKGLIGYLRAAQGSLLARQWHFEPGLILMEQGLSLMREADHPDQEKLAFTLALLSFLKIMHGQYLEAVRAAEESLSFFAQTGDYWTQAGALRLVGAASLYQGQLQQAQKYLDQCVAVCKTIGELRIRTYATSNLGVIYLWYGQIDKAREYFDDSLRISISCNDRLARADALCERGRLFISTGEFDLAVETALTCINLYRELGRDKVSLANIILGKALRLQGVDGAEEALREGLAAAQTVNHLPDTASAFEGLGAVAQDRQEYDLAEQYFRQSLAIWEEIGHEPEIAFILCRSASLLFASSAPDYERIRALLTRALGLARKHQVGSVALTAMAGLEAVRVRTGESHQAENVMSYALHHPATTLEVRRWIEQFMRQAGLHDLTATNNTVITWANWQALAQNWENSLICPV